MGIDNIIDKLNKVSQQKRKIYLNFFIKILDKLGFTPNILSFLKALSGFLFFIIVGVNFNIAFIILILGGLTDFFDGTLARYQKKDGDRGKFIDMLSDNIIFSFFILGLIKIGYANILNLSYFLFIIPNLYLIIIINKNEYIKNDWIISPYARISYYKIIFEIFFLLTLLFVIDRSILNTITTLLNISMSLHFLFHFYSFLDKKNK